MTNLTGICEYCNISKRDRPLLHQLLIVRMRPEIEALAMEYTSVTGHDEIRWRRRDARGTGRVNL